MYAIPVINFSNDLGSCTNVMEMFSVGSISRQFLALDYKLAGRSEQLTSTSPITNVYAHANALYSN